MSQAVINEAITHLFRGKPAQALDVIQKHAAEGSSPAVLTLLRHAAWRPGQSLLYYLRVHNIWQNLGKPALKPSIVNRRVVLFTDYTADGFVPLVSLFCAAFGVHADVRTTPFDSVEQLALDPTSQLDVQAKALVVLSLSEHWLARYFGNRCLVPLENVKRLEETLGGVIDGVMARGPDRLFVANFPPRAYPMPSGVARADQAIGWNRAVTSINHWLGDRCRGGVRMIDVAEAISGAGGRAALGRLSYFRSKMSYEAPGTIAVTKAMAAAVAHACGKTHRALLSDWDNTLWGGEVAEAGVNGLVCTIDNPDGLGYSLVQRFLKDLRLGGVLLGGASRNDPSVANVFDENPEWPLRREDFASLHVSFQPKSQAVADFAATVGFGPEFTVFLDDSLFEIAEVLTAHPHIDAIASGPDGQTTLQALSECGFFDATELSSEDLERSEAADRLRQQREVRGNYGSVDDFLKAIDIRLDVSPLNEKNAARVVQMFYKSNQFNLTTRRHGEAELRAFIAEGANLGVFSYEDAFGPQGIISVVNLVADSDGLRVESWLMSCRVLNRTVEQAVFHWIGERAAGLPVYGEFIPTEKNSLVRDLYRRLGFQLVSHDMGSGRELWRWCAGDGSGELPPHFARLREAA